MVEVMVAIILIAVAIIGIIGLYLSQARASGYTRHTTEAATLAEDQLEQLFRATAPCVVPCTGTGNDGGAIDSEARLGVGGIFTRSWTMTTSSATQTYWDITVTVTWYEAEDNTGAPPIHQVVLRGRRNL
jgi:type II secretory pathway pseudopilin PulG